LIGEQHIIKDHLIYKRVFAQYLFRIITGMYGVKVSLIIGNLGDIVVVKTVEGF